MSEAVCALRETVARPVLRMMWLCLVGTAVSFFMFGAGMQWALADPTEFGPDLAGGWVGTIIEFVARFLAVIVLIPLVHPVVSLVAGLFLENVAARVEAEDYPADPPGRDQPFWQSLLVAVRFTLVLIVVNLLALPFDPLPVVHSGSFCVFHVSLLVR